MNGEAGNQEKRCHVCGQQSVVLKKYTVCSRTQYINSFVSICNLPNWFLRTEKNSITASKADSGRLLK